MKINKIFWAAYFMILVASFQYLTAQEQAKPYEVFDQIIAGAGADTSAWVPIGSYKYVTLFAKLYTTSNSFALAINDSLGFDIDYDLHPGEGVTGKILPVDDTIGYTKKGDAGVKVEAMTFAIADTAYPRQYLTLDTGTPAFSRAAFVRFYLTKDAIHEKTVTSPIYLRLILWRQN